MGILSKIKKARKSLLKGVKKGFKSALAKVAKVLNNKYVKIALMVVSLVVPVIGMATAGWGQAAAQGAGFMGKLGGALGNVAKGLASMVVKTVTTPIKAVMNAGAKGASLFNANGLAATLSNGAKMVGNTSASLFGTVKADNLGQIVERWSGNGAVSDGVGQAVNTAAGMGTEGAPGQFGELANKVSADGGLIGGTAKTGGQFGDLASKVSADGALINAGQTGAQSGGMLQRGVGLMKKTAGFIEDNPTVAKMAFGAVSSAMAPDEAELLEAKYKLEDKYRQKDNAAWDSFNPNANTVASDASNQYAQATKAQPMDWRQRAEQARQYIAAPLLKRSYAGSYQ